MKATITSKGQITIPVKIRRKLRLEPGQVLEFDESVPFLKATKTFDTREMYSVVGCCGESLPGLTLEEWLNDTRGPVELPPDHDADCH